MHADDADESPEERELEYRVRVEEVGGLRAADGERPVEGGEGWRGVCERRLVDHGPEEVVAVDG